MNQVQRDDCWIELQTIAELVRFIADSASTLVFSHVYVFIMVFRESTACNSWWNQTKTGTRAQEKKLVKDRKIPKSEASCHVEDISWHDFWM